MSTERSLPELHNPLMEEKNTPSMDTLVGRRRLGQTNLAVKIGQVGLASSTKVERLGMFDYAHLRVPLPKDLAKSEIFARKEGGDYPESYFLMRRSDDGYISATGMFKAAFPWSTLKEEDAERRYHKQLSSGGGEEIAGNVWVAPDEALKLAEDYKIEPWIHALLDSAPIEKGTFKEKSKDEIATPPRFVLPEKGSLLPPPASSTIRTRGRELRSASPSKAATPARKIATPRKPRVARANKASLLNADAPKPTENGATPEPVPEKSEDPAAEAVEAEAVKIEVDETVEKKGDVETRTTTVKVEMPANHPDLPIPEETEKIIEKAREMVEQANELKAESNGMQVSRKRKVDDLVEEIDGSEQSDLVEQPIKKARKLEEALKSEKIQRRALVGTGTAMAIGAVASYFLWF